MYLVESIDTDLGPASLCCESAEVRGKPCVGELQTTESLDVTSSHELEARDTRSRTTSASVTCPTVPR